MTTYIILFRGINVGGHNKLPMKPLVSLLESHGFTNVMYYIQSGNVILDSEQEPTPAIVSLVSLNFNVTPQIIALTEEEFINIRANNPYIDEDGKSVHCYICTETPTLNSEKTEKYQLRNERITLVNNTLYLHAPDGIGRSKLVSNIEDCLGVSATGRNMNTINKVFSLIKNPDLI